MLDSTFLQKSVITLRWGTIWFDIYVTGTRGARHLKRHVPTSLFDGNRRVYCSLCRLVIGISWLCCSFCNASTTASSTHTNCLPLSPAHTSDVSISLVLVQIYGWGFVTEYEFYIARLLGSSPDWFNVVLSLTRTSATNGRDTRRMPEL